MAARSVLILLGAATVCLVGTLGRRFAAISRPSRPLPHRPKTPPSRSKIPPFLKKYCIECHNGDKAKGGLDARRLPERGPRPQGPQELGRGPARPRGRRDAARRRSRSRPRTRSEFVINWIENTLTKVDCGRPPKTPAASRIRRLNRAEYNNTIRDLCGVDFKPADDFPADDVGYGFDNIGDVLSFQPILLEKYLAAADKILDDRAHARRSRSRVDKQTLPPAEHQRHPAQREVASERPVDRSSSRPRARRSCEKFNFPAEGEYVVRFRGWGTQGRRRVPEGDHPRGRQGRQDVHGRGRRRASRRPTRRRRSSPAGEKRVAVAFTNAVRGQGREEVPRVRPRSRSRSRGRSTPVAAAGPGVGEAAPRRAPDRPRPSRVPRPRRCSTTSPAGPTAGRSSRTKSTRLMKLFDVADQAGRAVRAGDQAADEGGAGVAALPLPHRGRPEEPQRRPHAQRLRAGHAAVVLPLVQMPDEELFASPRRANSASRACSKRRSSGCSRTRRRRRWSRTSPASGSQLRNAQDAHARTRATSRAGTTQLRTAMVRETELFFEHVVRNDRSVLEFLDADYTFVNDRLAQHYGIAGRLRRRVPQGEAAGQPPRRRPHAWPAC